MYKTSFDAKSFGRFISGTGSGIGGALGHAVGKTMLLPAAYAGGALAAGIGIPVGTYKLLEYLGDKGKTSELEKRLLMQQLADSQTKIGSVNCIGLLGSRYQEKLARAVTPEIVDYIPSNTINVTNGFSEGHSVHPQGQESINSWSRYEPVNKPNFNIPHNRSTTLQTISNPKKRMNPWLKRGLIGTGLLGIGYGTYKMLSPSQKEQPQPYYPAYR